MNIIDKYLQLSAQLYKLLGTIPSSEERLQFIESIHELLDQRGLLVEQIKNEGFNFNLELKMHHTLFELDKGIKNRLNLVMDAVKNDIKDLQNTKKNESQYIDPYKDLRVVEGRYFDNKK